MQHALYCVLLLLEYCFSQSFNMVWHLVCLFQGKECARALALMKMDDAGESSV